MKADAQEILDILETSHSWAEKSPRGHQTAERLRAIATSLVSLDEVDIADTDACIAALCAAGIESESIRAADILRVVNAQYEEGVRVEKTCADIAQERSDLVWAGVGP